MIVNFILYNADTTDVQNATVTFFGTRIYLTCTFANRTSAMGCIIKFTLSSNRTEQFNITRTEAQLCSMVANQMIAYDRVEVVDWEAGGTSMDGLIPFGRPYLISNQLAWVELF